MAMPKYAEYVFTVYGLFAVVIGGYTVWIMIKIRAAHRALDALERQNKS